MRPRIPRPSPALLVAILALSLTMGGVSYAAAKLPRNSVGTPQLKVGAVTGWKVRNNTLTGADIREGTLKAPGGERAFVGTDFRPVDSSIEFDAQNGRLVSNGPGRFRVNLNLPPGARLRAIELAGSDTEDILNIVLTLREVDPLGGQMENVLSWASEGAGGDFNADIRVDPKVRIESQKAYVLDLVFMNPNDFDPPRAGDRLALDGVLVKWAPAQ